MNGLRDCPALRAGPVTTVADVIERLAEVRDGTAGLAPHCGITHFSDLYATITASIDRHVRTGGFFADGGYLARLDVVFANRYFDALRAWAGGGRAPAAWRLLFDLPDDGEVTALQLAGGGVNAHINLDLAVAVVDTGREFGDAELLLRRVDYDKVNDVFAEEMAGLLARLAEHHEARGEPTDRLHVLGAVVTGIVAQARRHAWADAGTLWSLPRASEQWAVREGSMDEAAARIGQLLLVDLPG
jgi:hypothetical protein